MHESNVKGKDLPLVRRRRWTLEALLRRGRHASIIFVLLTPLVAQSEDSAAEKRRELLRLMEEVKRERREQEQRDREAQAQARAERAAAQAAQRQRAKEAQEQRERDRREAAAHRAEIEAYKAEQRRFNEELRRVAKENGL